jgi:hypothetical protein
MRHEFTHRTLKMNMRNTLKRILVGPQEDVVSDLGRNDRCWCGSGRKYKTCHMAADDRKRSTARSGGTQRVPSRGF